MSGGARWALREGLGPLGPLIRNTTASPGPGLGPDGPFGLGPRARRHRKRSAARKRRARGRPISDRMRAAPPAGGRALSRSPRLKLLGRRRPCSGGARTRKPAGPGPPLATALRDIFRHGPVAPRVRTRCRPGPSPRGPSRVSHGDMTWIPWLGAHDSDLRARADAAGRRRLVRTPRLQAADAAPP